MDVRYFLKQRVEFIRQFYVISSAAYIERKRLIEAEEEPFIPPYSEDPEPAFLDEWLEAEESLQVLGRTCLSMLAAIADEQGLLMADPDHSADEDRFILLGVSARLRLLVVCHTYQEEDEVIRLIAARTADRSERAQYSRRWKR